MNVKSKFFYSAWRVLFALVFSLSVAGLSVRSALAAGYVVTNLNNGGAGSLRQAINNANANGGADTITFTVSGTITLTSALPAITDDLTIDGGGQSITINGNNLYRVFTVNSGKTVILNALVISQGYGGAVGGGGILNDGGTVTVRNCTFIDNKADTYGGAILTNTSATVQNSTFKSNTAQYGGAIHNDGGTLTVVNSTFSANSASLFGGGISNFNAGDMTALNSTFSANSASDTGGGIYVSTDSSLTLKNTILANSASGGDCTNLGTLVADVNNLIENNSGCGTPVSSADPMLAPLNNNGGSTQTFALYAGSPAIHAGDDATCTAAPVNNLDQRGQTRPYGAHCDIGSVEVRNESAAMTFRSMGVYDGWILESGENTNAGGSRNVDATTFYVGDGAGDKQYRAILSFNTANLPDNAVITNVTLKIKKQAPVGTDPFTILGGLKVDMRKPYFGTGALLAVSDFQAAAGRVGAATFNPLPVNNWYSAVLNSVYRSYVNLKGSTQFRLYFTLDDNNDNAADYMKFFSGNYATVAARPMLIIDYYLP